jgi:hypothetical protein
VILKEVEAEARQPENTSNCVSIEEFRRAPDH